MRVVELNEITVALSQPTVVAAIREALVRHAEGRVISPPPGQLVFDEPPGDCHIKFGRFVGADRFVIKVATGFYDNLRSGLPVNNGLVIVLDARTGRPEALLQDCGWLTSWRTAAAGALAAEAGRPDNVMSLGIVGTGHQARLQAVWVAQHLGVREVRVFGRSVPRAQELAGRLREQGLRASAAQSIEQLLGECRVVITCTPATAPVIPARLVLPGTHIVALGADTPGKQELEPELFCRADTVMCDDVSQCVDHGDLSYAIRAGLFEPGSALSLGDVLAGRRRGRTRPEHITIADLTGIPAQDVAIATRALEAIEREPARTEGAGALATS